MSDFVSAEERLAHAFYETWLPGKQPTSGDLSELRQRIEEEGIDVVESAIACFMANLREGWEDCKSLSGAIKQGYLDSAIEEQKATKRREQFNREQAEARRLEKQRDEQQRQQDEQYHAMVKGQWMELSEVERESIRNQAIDESESMFLQPQYRKSPIDENASLFLLDYFARQRGLTESCQV